MTDKNGATGAKPDVDAIREDIKQTRAELGETVQALAAKADVKARAKDQVEQTKQRVKAQAAEATGKVRDAASLATDKVRTAADTVRGTAADATGKVRETSAADVAQQARIQVRSNPVPVVAVFALGAAVLGIVLILRGRRQ